MDRPGPALQMFKNFIQNDPSQDKLINYSMPLSPKDLKPTKSVTRKVIKPRKSAKYRKLL
jgi:hypothetical protein